MRKVHLRLRAGLLGAVGVVFVALAVAMIGGDMTANDAKASIVSAFVGLAALATSLVALIPQPGAPSKAEDLAADLAETIRGEWLDEADSRRLRDPKVLPLTWSTGRMDGRLEDAAHQLATEYRSIRTGRALILGEPGSGKTVLAMLLTLGLITDRAPTSPVPVLLPASSWDPVRDPLDDWIIHTLAGAYYNGRTDTPRMLLTRGLVLPVLDGLDEIPEVARRHAVQRINAAVGAERPVVVTCRAVEYDDLIDAGSPALRLAPVLRVEPIAVQDVIDHLKAVPDWPHGTVWTAVYEELCREPDGPVAAALSTPLMISLAETVYRSSGGDPSELLDTDLFPSRIAIEDHLIDRTIDTAYAPDPQGPPSRWTGAKGRTWLTFLARYLHDYRERDLAWWRLADRLVSPWVAPMLGITAGLGVTLVVAGLAATSFAENRDDAFSFAAPVGIIVTLLATTLWYGATGRAPGRMGLVRRGSMRRLHRGFRAGAAFVLIPGVPVYSIGAIATFLFQDIDFASIRDLVQAATLVVAVMCIAGCAVAAHHWLDAIAERSARATPLGFMRQDRRAAIVGATVAGAVAAVLTWPVLITATFVGDVLGQGLAGWFGMTGATYFLPLDRSFGLKGTAQTVSALIAVPFLAVTLLVLLTRAWPRFVLTRIVLAATGRLPWRLLTFLADARDRGLLRQSGGTYQFRHVRLQERLALPTDDTPTTHAIPASSARHRRAIAVALVAAVLATAVGTLTTFNHLRCMSVFSMDTKVDQARIYGDNEQYCVGIVREAELNELARKYGAVARLREANRQIEDQAHSTVAVILPLGPVPLSPQTLSYVDGVALAQREGLRLGHPTKALLVSRDVDRPSVALGRLEAYRGRANPPIRAVVGDVSPHLETDDIPVYGPPAALPDSRERTLEGTTMNEFVRSTLRPKHISTISTTNSKQYHDFCAQTDGVVALIVRSIEPHPADLDDLACDRNPIVVTDESQTAAYLRAVSSEPFRNLTLYYPVQRTSRAQSYLEATAEARLPSDSIELRSAYHAMLNAAGISDFAIHQLSATPNGWVATVVRP